MRNIVKVGLAILDDERILLVRKRGSSFLILPGGKPEAGEDDMATLSREIGEELGCEVGPAAPVPLGTFSDKVAGNEDATVEVRLYEGTLQGVPQPRSEIDELAWVSLDSQDRVDLAPSLRNLILPFIASTRCRAAPVTTEPSPP